MLPRKTHEPQKPTFCVETRLQLPHPEPLMTTNSCPKLKRKRSNFWLTKDTLIQSQSPCPRRTSRSLLLQDCKRCLNKCKMWALLKISYSSLRASQLALAIRISWSQSSCAPSKLSMTRMAHFMLMVQSLLKPTKCRFASVTPSAHSSSLQLARRLRILSF